MFINYRFKLIIEYKTNKKYFKILKIFKNEKKRLFKNKTFFDVIKFFNI